LIYGELSSNFNANIDKYKLKGKTVFSTPWFNIIESYYSDISNIPYYGLQLLDYCNILAITNQSEIVLVKQYRPAVDKYTLEFPGGHVEKEQKPEQAVKNELYEETGYIAGEIKLLGALDPDVGRLANKVWCYYSTDISKPVDGKWIPEKNVDLIKYPVEKISELVKNNQLNNAMNIAALYLAVQKGIDLQEI